MGFQNKPSAFSVSVILSVVLSVYIIECQAIRSAHGNYEPGFWRRQTSFNPFFGTLKIGNFLGSSEEDFSNVVIDRRDYFRQKRPMSVTPVCPERSQRYHRGTNACHTVGTRGPCGPLQIFFGSEFISKEDGQCACDPGYNRPLINVNGKCHFLFTQAFCDPGYWLVFSSFNGPQCIPNKCHKTRTIFPYSQPQMVLYQGECVKLNSPSRLCPNKDDIVSFRQGTSDPVCIPEVGEIGITRSRRQVAKTNEFKCQEGYAKAKGTSRCRRLGRITFN